MIKLREPRKIISGAVLAAAIVSLGVGHALVQDRAVAENGDV